ncbi:MAG TPA: glycosyltransferase family 1 protein [Gemmatimonadales bacterium]|nr:glycosyltransferase family 1 protein [Gemmatimonadales bacterium]
MRVLYCTDTYPPQINGVSVVTALSVAGLSRLGWECAVIAPKYPRATHAVWNDPDTGGRPCLRLDLTSFPLPGYSEVRLTLPAPAPVHRLVAEFGPDLVHCATEFTVGRMGQVAADRAGIPLVSSYHTDFSQYAEAYGKGWLRGTVSAYLKRFHQRSRRVYTPSTVSREDLLRLNVPDVEVWGRGVDAQRFNPGRRSAGLRADLGLDGRYTFLYVGRLAPEKRPEQILDAFRLAREMLPKDSIRLIMAGTGPREAELRAIAPPGVTFIGFLDRRSLLPELYASCDAFVFASVTETLGLVVLEAMASGLPVIAAPAGGVRDHLRDGYNGMAYPAGSAYEMGSAMARMAWDRVLTERLGLGARRTAEELTWDHEMIRLDRSYREVCGAEVATAAA